MKVTIILFLLTGLFFFGCSSSQETTKEEKDTSEEQEIYVFDDVTEFDSTEVEYEDEDETIVYEQQEKVTEYYVQVGAYTTRERADAFVREAATETAYPMDIEYSDRVGLYVIQLPPFTTYDEAAAVRNQLWQKPIFKDAFVVTKEN